MANLSVSSALGGYATLSMWNGARALAAPVSPGSIALSSPQASSPAAYASLSNDAKALAASSAPGPQAAATPSTVNTLPSKSGNKSVDALIYGKTYWWTDWSNQVAKASATGVTGAKHELTFSFMSQANSSSASDQYGFAAMSNSEKAAVRDALSYVSSVADLTFTEVESGGNLQFGTNKQSGRSAGYAYLPNSAARNVASVYLANDVFDPNTTDWSEGSQGWKTLIHEIGHALGLKHPGNYNAGGGGTPGPYLAKSADNTANSVMSYYSPGNATYVDTSTNPQGQTVLSFQSVAPEGYQMLDMAALQYLYGASKDADANSAKTYSYDPADHNNNRFMETIWNPNSGSVIDASAQTKSCVISLKAGTFSSIGIRSAYEDLPGSLSTAAGYVAALGKKATKPTYDGRNNLAIAAGSHIDAVKTGSGADTVVGNDDATNTIDTGAGNDVIFLGSGNATVDGGDGTDTVCLAALKRGQSWKVSFDADTRTYTVTGGGRTEVLRNVESIRTWDGKTLKAKGGQLAVLA